jgi:hypothetical protein
VGSVIGPNVGVRALATVECHEHRESGKHLEDVSILMSFRNALSALHRGVSGTRQDIGRALHPACEGWYETSPAP